MKYFILCAATLLSLVTFGQAKQSIDTANSNPQYNKALAEKLGGDEYGMKSYFL